jgi:hypothetical protein
MRSTEPPSGKYPSPAIRDPWLIGGAAHPVNFVGTQANTRSGNRPFLRLAHTAKAFETIFFGTRAEADRVLAFVERVHSRVAGELDADAGPWPAGTGYTAFDPELMLWTVAVIADSAEAFFELLVRRLTPDEKDALWADYVRFGELFGMPRAAAPPTYAGFREYWDEMWTGGELHLTDEARAVALAVAREAHVRCPLEPPTRGGLPLGGRRAPCRAPARSGARAPRDQHVVVRPRRPHGALAGRGRPGNAAVAGRVGPLAA